jgi:3-oxoadipate enol-lactonase
MAFTQINNLTIHYQVEGSAGSPALVFVNSLGSDWRIWDEVVPHFSGRFFVIRYDKRGHGLSDCPPGPYTIGTLADDLAGLLDDLGVNTAVPIGISVGGMIALAFAARYPPRVPKLVLSNTGAVIGTAVYWAERIAALKANGFDELGSGILARWFSPAFAQAQPAAYCGYGNMLRRTPLAGYIATCAAIRDADLRDAARSVQVPTLVLCGAEDAAAPPELSQALVEMLGNGRYHLIPHAAHLPCIEQPQKMAEAIAEFIG